MSQDAQASVRLNRWLALCALLGALSGTGRASIIDPQMGVTEAGDSTEFTNGIVFGPDSFGGGATEYYNGTGGIITSLTFSTEIFLTPDQLASLACNSSQDPTSPNPFFLNCVIDYFAGQGQNPGLLEFLFYGTNSGTGGTDEGIPPLANFDITFNYNYSLTVDSGGWGALGNPTFTATDVGLDPSPEPRSAELVGVALIAGGALLALRLWRARRSARRLAHWSA